MSGWRWVEKVQKVKRGQWMAMGRIVQMGRECREGMDGQRGQRGYREQRRYRKYRWVQKVEMVWMSRERTGGQIGLMFLLAAFFVAAWVGIGGTYILYYIIQYMVQRQRWQREYRRYILGAGSRIMLRRLQDYETTSAVALLFAQQKEFSRFSQFTNYFRDIMSCERAKPP